MVGEDCPSQHLNKSLNGGGMGNDDNKSVIESGVSRIGAVGVSCAILFALVSTIIVCLACRSFFVRDVVQIDFLAPQDDVMFSAATVYYKSLTDPQLSERQKCRQGIGPDKLKENQGHVLVEIPTNATTFRLDLWFSPATKTKPATLPLTFFTIAGEKTYEVRMWNKNTMSIMLDARDFHKVEFFGLRLFSLSTIVFLCAFAVGLLAYHGVKHGWAFFFVFFLLVMIIIPNWEMSELEASASENRTLAKFPDVSQIGFWDVSSFCKKFSAAYEDRFWGRNELISMHSSILRVFDDDRGNANAHIGRNGWWFLMKTLDDFSNKEPPFNDAVLDAICGNLTALSEYAHKNGKAFVLFVAPDKCRVYPEYVRGYRKMKGDDESRTEQLISEMRKRCDFPIVYPRKLMLELKNKLSFPLYYKNDTHWTCEAAYYAGYQMIMESIMKDKFYKRGGQVLQIEQWHLGKRPVGDLNRMLQLPSMHEEQDYNFPILPDKHVTRKTRKLTNTRRVLSSTNTDGKMRAFCFGDSFSTNLFPFFECSFHISHLAPVPAAMNLADEDWQALKESDVIVLEIVERNILFLSALVIPKDL